MARAKNHTEPWFRWICKPFVCNIRVLKKPVARCNWNPPALKVRRSLDELGPSSRCVPALHCNHSRYEVGTPFCFRSLRFPRVKKKKLNCRCRMVPVPIAKGPNVSRPKGSHGIDENRNPKCSALLSLVEYPINILKWPKPNICPCGCETVLNSSSVHHVKQTTNAISQHLPSCQISYITRK